MKSIPYFLFASMLFFNSYLSAQPTESRYDLVDFKMQASVLVAENGDRLSDPLYRSPIYWFPVKVPSTVLSGLVANKVYPNPYEGMNNMYIPDASDEFNKQYQLEKYSHIPGQSNPWKKPYWYRTTFKVPSAVDRNYHLVFKGINYRAEVWLNGKRVADSTEMVGMFAEYELPVSNFIKAGQLNGLAVKIYPLDYPGIPAREQLKIFDDFYENGGPTGDIGKNVTMLCSVGWDWIPPVRDRNMGIWQPVYLRTTGDIKINYPRVNAKFEASDTTSVNLTLDLALENLNGSARSVNLNVKIEPDNFEGGTVSFNYPVQLSGKKITKVNITSQQVQELKIQKPALWWPLGYGKPNLYRVIIEVETSTGVSDKKIIRTGIRTVSSSVINTKNSVRRDFYVNGKRIHLVGGAWVPDMMLQNDSLRIARELQLVKNANMNLVRIWGGGVTPSDLFFDLCDRLGLLVWSDFWVTGDTQGEFKGSPDWPLEGHVFVKNVTNTIYRIRHHASLLVWTGGNEGHARKELYDAMRDSVALIDGTRPFIPSSSGFAKLPDGWKGSWPDDQPSGVYSGGPYTWKDPKVLYELAEKAPDWVFKDETGIPSQPPYTTLPKIIPNLVWDKKSPFPFNDTWGYHDAATGNGRYDLYVSDMVKRFGEPTSMEDFSNKMQLMNAMGYQGIFEAAQSRLNETGGVMLWKLNPAFPSVMWQIYDWYMLPNAGYYFARQACAPLHMQFNRNTNFIDVINRSYKTLQGVTAEVEIWDVNGKKLFSAAEKINMTPSSVLKWKSVSAWKQTPGIQFLLLRLRNQQGALLNQNTYWLEVQDNFTTLSGIKKAQVNASITMDKKERGGREITVHLQNNSNQLAFFTRVQLLDATGEEVLPSNWSDNYMSLKPGEQHTLTVWLDSSAFVPRAMRISGWNLDEVFTEIK
ncbi:MAG: beta galactosidase jelly roll domain-containing protein [Bacteroidota bacterium]